MQKLIFVFIFAITGLVGSLSWAGHPEDKEIAKHEIQKFLPIALSGTSEEFHVGQLLYYLGRQYHIIEDFKNAFHWVRRSAFEENYLGAACYLGLMYEEGVGTPKDNVRAFMMFVKATSWEAKDDNCKKHLDLVSKLLTPRQIYDAHELISLQEWKGIRRIGAAWGYDMAIKCSAMYYFRTADVEYQNQQNETRGKLSLYIAQAYYQEMENIAFGKTISQGFMLANRDLLLSEKYAPTFIYKKYTIAKDCDEWLELIESSLGKIDKIAESLEARKFFLYSVIFPKYETSDMPEENYKHLINHIDKAEVAHRGAEIKSRSEFKKQLQKQLDE